jgi:hypothetical protein
MVWGRHSSPDWRGPRPGAGLSWPSWMTLLVAKPTQSLPLCFSHAEILAEISDIAPPNSPSSRGSHLVNPDQPRLRRHKTGSRHQRAGKGLVASLTAVPCLGNENFLERQSRWQEKETQRSSRPPVSAPPNSRATSKWTRVQLINAGLSRTAGPAATQY